MNSGFTRLLVAIGLTAGSLTSSAAIVLYPELTTSLTGQGSTSGLVALDAAHRFTDPDAGTPVAGLDRFYGGTIQVSQMDWGIEGGLFFFKSTFDNTGDSYDGNRMGWRLYLGEGTNSTWAINTNASQSHNSGVPGTTALDFVFRVRDNDWNTAMLDIYLGSKALSATEPLAPDASIGINNLQAASPLSQLQFRKQGWGSAGTFTLANVFSSDSWSPVTPVPEPAHLVGLVGLAALMLVWVRRS